MWWMPFCCSRFLSVGCWIEKNRISLFCRFRDNTSKEFRIIYIHNITFRGIHYLWEMKQVKANQWLVIIHLQWFFSLKDFDAIEKFGSIKNEAPFLKIWNCRWRHKFWLIVSHHKQWNSCGGGGRFKKRLKRVWFQSFAAPVPMIHHLTALAFLVIHTLLTFTYRLILISKITFYFISFSLRYPGSKQ